jgi:hypothetical protein
MNISNWYNPDNVTVTGGYVTAWNDSMGIYNLTTVGSGGTGNNMTKVVASGTTSNVIYQLSNNGAANFAYLYGGTTFTQPIYAVTFCANTTSLNSTGYSQIWEDKVSGQQGILKLVGVRGLDGYDLNNGSPTYVNGVNVYTPNQVNLPSTTPTGYTIYCFYVQPVYRSAMTQLLLLGSIISNYGFIGYAGDFFVGNSNFGTNQQQQLEGYLGYKYKCQSSLPTNHPFYSATNSKVVTLS